MKEMLQQFNQIKEDLQGQIEKEITHKNEIKRKSIS